MYLLGTYYLGTIGTYFQSFCTSGYLFDEDVGRCVPAAVCGTVGDAVADSMSLAKGMCDGIQDGVAMGSGTCLNYYYVCMKVSPFCCKVSYFLVPLLLGSFRVCRFADVASSISRHFPQLPVLAYPAHRILSA